MKDIYKTYGPDKLASDPDFIDWVKNKDNINTHLWDEWLEANPDSHSLMQEAVEIVQELSFQELDTQGAANRIWSRIEASTDEQNEAKDPSKVVNIPLRFFIAAIAAGLALLLYFQFFMGSSVTIRTFAGQDQIQILPDASTIHLNDASTLSYDENSYPANRAMKLEGEAFFQVTKGAPFVVATAQGSVEVLGTSFNVFSRKSGFEVRCHTGKVRVKTSESEVILLPGQVFGRMADRDKKDVERFDPGNYRDWRSGVFNFQRASLGDVMEEIERQFDVTVTLDEDLARIKYTGFFMEENLEEALYSVCWPLNLAYQIVRGNVIIRPNLKEN